MIILILLAFFINFIFYVQGSNDLHLLTSVPQNELKLQYEPSELSKSYLSYKKKKSSNKINKKRRKKKKRNIVINNSTNNIDTKHNFYNIGSLEDNKIYCKKENMIINESFEKEYGWKLIENWLKNDKKVIIKNINSNNNDNNSANTNTDSMVNSIVNCAVNDKFLYFCKYSDIMLDFSRSKPRGIIKLFFKNFFNTYGTIVNKFSPIFSDIPGFSHHVEVEVDKNIRSSGGNRSTSSHGRSVHSNIGNRNGSSISNGKNSDRSTNAKKESSGSSSNSSIIDIPMSSSTARCDYAEIRPTFLISHDDIFNLGW